MNWLHVASGALTGFIVGLTGVGGGALMTPILVLVFGMAPLAAIGTDLWFAALTKLVITGMHQRRLLIDWPIVRLLWMGSLPASAGMLITMHLAPAIAGNTQFLKGAIAVAVCLTAIGLTVQKRLHALGTEINRRAGGLRHWQAPATVAAGAALGVLVTLTSVGAGALGTVCLLYLYPARLTPPRLIATDVAHAIPLAMFAGLGHLVIGNVDPGLLRDLLLGSIPAAAAGTFLSARMSHTGLRLSLGLVLLVIAVKMIADVWTQ